MVLRISLRCITHLHLDHNKSGCSESGTQACNAVEEPFFLTHMQCWLQDNATAADLALCNGHQTVAALLDSRPSAPPHAVVTGSNPASHGPQTASTSSSFANQAASGVSLPSCSSHSTPIAEAHTPASNAGLQSAAARSGFIPYPTLFARSNADAGPVEEPASRSASMYAQACEAVVGIGKVLSLPHNAMLMAQRCYSLKCRVNCKTSLQMAYCLQC